MLNRFPDAPSKGCVFGHGSETPGQMSLRSVPDARQVLPGAVAVVLLLATLALAAGAGLAAIDAGQPDVVTAGNTTSYLHPAGEQTRSSVTAMTVDASVAITASVQRLHGDVERLAFDERYVAAVSQSDRAQLFGDRVDMLEARIDAITAARQAAIAAHSAGELDSSAFVHTLARVEVAAARAARLRNLLQNRSILAGSPQQSFRADLQTMQVELASLRGPASNRLLAGLRGTAQPNALYVYTADGNGLVIAAVSSDQYYRDALDATQRQVGGVNEFTNGTELGIGVAYQRAADLYPWIFRENVAPGPATPYANTSVYSITVDHSQGRLSTYLDGSTEGVFRELQQKRLTVVPLDERSTATANGLRVFVNGTHPTGPLHVRLVQAGTGNAVDGDIRIDGRLVGRTGADGRLWTIQPDGTYTLNATAAGNSVSLTLR